MQISLQSLEWLSIYIVQSSRITGPVEMKWTLCSRHTTAESLLYTQYKTVFEYWTLIWIICVVMQKRLPYFQWLSMEIVQVNGITSLATWQQCKTDASLDYRGVSRLWHFDPLELDTPQSYTGPWIKMNVKFGQIMDFWQDFNQSHEWHSDFKRLVFWFSCHDSYDVQYQKYVFRAGFGRTWATLWLWRFSLKWWQAAEY